MSVHRTKPLPEAPARGCLIVAEPTLRRTRDLLLQAGASRPAHEGLVWWLGRHVDGDTIVLSCHRPACDSGPGHVFADEAATGVAARLARAQQLGLVAQVHSHPGRDTRHSDGDDDLVLMPYEGMFSLVVAQYGHGSLLPEQGAGLHQFQDHRWIGVRQPEPGFLVAPVELTSRERGRDGE